MLGVFSAPAGSPQRILLIIAWGAGVGTRNQDNITKATYHHVVKESSDVVCLDCRLGKENLAVRFDVLLRSETLAGVCWWRDWWLPRDQVAEAHWDEQVC